MDDMVEEDFTLADAEALRLRVISIHEASHGRIAHLYGYRVECLIDEDPATTRRSGTTLYHLPETAVPGESLRKFDEAPAAIRTAALDEWHFAWATIALAGIESERLLYSDLLPDEVILAYGNTDLSHAADNIVEMSTAPRRFEALLARAHAVARGLVREHQLAITMIAAALLRERHLGPDRISTIIADAERHERSEDAA